MIEEEYNIKSLREDLLDMWDRADKLETKRRDILAHLQEKKQDYNELDIVRIIKILDGIQQMSLGLIKDATLIQHKLRHH